MLQEASDPKPQTLNPKDPDDMVNLRKCPTQLLTFAINT